jgi:predicted ABC-type ATPase
MKNRKSLFTQTLIFKVLILLISFSSAKWASADLDKTDFSNTNIYSPYKVHQIAVQRTPDSVSEPDIEGLEQMEKSTADLYRRDDRIFVGDFIESRSKVDFNYHRNYQLERQLFQDHIIHKYLKFGKSVNSPKIIFTAGVMGTGKGHVLKKMDSSKLICLQDYLLIDSDQLKYELPEMKLYIHFDPKTAGTKVHKESGFIQEIILFEALKQNKNIIVDGTLTSLDCHKKLFESIRKEYPQYRIEIIHVIADMDKIKERIHKRGEQTGRFVPLEKAEYAYHQVPKTVKALTPLVSKILTIDNNKEEEDFDAPLPLRVRG